MFQLIAGAFSTSSQIELTEYNVGQFLMASLEADQRQTVRGYSELPNIVRKLLADWYASEEPITRADFEAACTRASPTTYGFLGNGLRP
jgi:hypothetical protein